ncbi:MAG: DUF6527 family protein [Gammaproteobacteria bacterium]
MRRERITFEFVEFIPKEQDLKEGVLYISIPYSTAVHKCCSGCGYKVVTPISPTDWTLIFDRDTISLDPSIGNWSLPCKSHYWIRRNRVEWAPKWTASEIEAGRAESRETKEDYYNVDPSQARESKPSDAETRFWQRFRKWWPKK